jgi:nitroimidazol reductase NimA-like FMN-containing flavoprotein (pyridoxamine 5'-phosphate oxidase superfamily)
MKRTLEILSRAESLRLLESVPIGRLIYTHHAMPAVVPVNFVVDGSELLVRAGYGGALAAGIRGSVVAFEADDLDVNRQEGWSVTVTGQAREELDAAELQRLASLHLEPWADGDRDHFLKISTDIVQGRRLRNVEVAARV